VIYLYAAVFLAGFEQQGMKALIIFTSLAALINIYKIFTIIIDRYPILLPDFLKKPYNDIFYHMSANNFYKKIYPLAKIQKYIRGDILAREGEILNQLILITDGTALIRKNHKRIAVLQDSNFVGEMSFLAGGPATATVEVISEEAECLVWDKKMLSKISRSNADLYAKLQQSIAVNLVSKLALASDAHVSAEAVD